jgi:hypothetical protein
MVTIDNPRTALATEESDQRIVLHGIERLCRCRLLRSAGPNPNERVDHQRGEL